MDIESIMQFIFAFFLHNLLKIFKIKHLTTELARELSQPKEADRPGRLEELDPDLIEEEEREDQS